MDHDHLESMRQHHPAWRLLRADSAAFVAAVLHRVFVVRNARTLSEEQLLEAVDDELFRLRQSDPDAYPRGAAQYVADWSDAERGWLRKFYPRGSDVPAYDLSPAVEKALSWLDSLAERSFVGTESRLLTLFQLLQQLVEGSQDDPQERLAILKRRRAEIDAEIAAVERGEVRLLDDTAVRDRFQQFTATARDLLADFREVEDNFRRLDRGVREQIAAWEGSRGALLDDVFGGREAISESDQGRSFQAFWDFLMSADRQEEFTRLLGDVLELPAVRGADPSLRHVVSDWLTAADGVQITVAHLSQQLRRFLDDRAYLENRRISELMRAIEAKALKARDAQPRGVFAELDEAKADISLPMARRLYERAASIDLATGPVDCGDESFDADALFEQFTVDPAPLRDAIAVQLQRRDQVSLADVVAAHPVAQGLSEIVAYLTIADGDQNATFISGSSQTLDWSDGGTLRRAEVPHIVFTAAQGDDDA
jgi:hypothetical protein